MIRNDVSISIIRARLMIDSECRSASINRCVSVLKFFFSRLREIGSANNRRTIRVWWISPEKTRSSTRAQAWRPRPRASSDSSESNSTYIKIACILASSLNMALRERKILLRALTRASLVIARETPNLQTSYMIFSVQNLALYRAQWADFSLKEAT